SDPSAANPVCAVNAVQVAPGMIGSCHSVGVSGGGLATDNEQCLVIDTKTGEVEIDKSFSFLKGGDDPSFGISDSSIYSNGGIEDQGELQPVGSLSIKQGNTEVEYEVDIGVGKHGQLVYTVLVTVTVTAQTNKAKTEEEPEEGLEVEVTG